MKQTSVILLCTLTGFAEAFQSTFHRFGMATTLRQKESRLHSDAYLAQYDNYGDSMVGVEDDVPPVAPVMPEPIGGPLAFRSDPYTEMQETMRRQQSLADLPYRDMPPLETLEPYNERDFERIPGRRVPYGSSDIGIGPNDTLQGNSRFSYTSPRYGASHVVDLSSNGRDMYGTVELWIGPDNTPQKFKIYSQEGSRNRVRAVLSSDQASTVSVKNEGSLQFPMLTQVTPLPYSPREEEYRLSLNPGGRPEGLKMQGEGTVKTFNIPSEVSSVMITLQTEGLPLTGKMEVLEGPNNVKIDVEAYNDGIHGPTRLILDTPGLSKTLRIKNIGPMAYPFYALVEPYSYSDPYEEEYYRRNGSNGITASRFDRNGRYREDAYESGYGDSYGYGRRRSPNSFSRFDRNGRYVGTPW